MSKKKCALLFPGQGSQFVGMGKDLYDNFPIAKDIYDKAASALDFDVRAISFEGPEEMLTKTRYSQPAIFVSSMAAFEVLRNHQAYQLFEPIAAAGLSLGEATALCAAGAIDFLEGVRFVRERGKAMDEASVERPGLMAAVLGADLALVEKVCNETGAEVGNLNAPSQIVISGAKVKVEKAIEQLKAQGAKKVIPLDVSGGFHSSCMEPACRHIEESLKSVNIQPPKIGVISNLTAASEADPLKIKQNLIWQMNHRTLWEQSMRVMIAQGVEAFLEVGPGKILKGLMKKIDPTKEVICFGGWEDFHAS